MPYVQVNPAGNSFATIFNTHFEATFEKPGVHHKFVTGHAVCRGCTFGNNNGQKLEITGDAKLSLILVRSRAALPPMCPR